MNKMSTLLIMLFICLNATAQDITGSWTGKLNLNGMKLNLVFNITKDKDGTMTCTFDSPDQGAKGIPAEISVTDGTKVKIDISAIKATYEGEMKDGMLKGSLSQSGMSFPLEMKPGTVKRNRPQTPRPPYPYTTEEVTFGNAADNVSLSGTLTYPEGFDKRAKGSVPVVIMVTGSGLQNRDEEIFDHKPFLVIADFLARNGIASLRYDDRGAGKSTGDPATATSENNMKDALAAIEYIHKTGKFGKTGILGHSEGGCIAFMIAARGKADFIVSMAGPGTDGTEILVKQNEMALKLSGVPTETADEYCKALRAVLTAVTHNDTTSTVHDIIKRAGIKLPAPAINNLSMVMKQCSSPWMRYFIAYNPAEDIKNTRCPVMAINGGKDTQVEAETNLAAISNLLPQTSGNLIKTYPWLNHLFQPCTTGLPAEYGQIEQTISQEVLKDIAEWINKQPRG